MRAAPVGLLTDFGRDDPYLAETKAALLECWAAVPSLEAGPLIDLCHTIPPGDVAAGAWFLARLRRALPPGSVTLAVVDPGVGTERPAVAAAADGRFWVGPGNGLLAWLGGAADLRVVRLEDARLCRRPGGGEPAATFHGRDLFAPAAARLAAGVPLERLGGALGVEALGVAPAPSSSAEGSSARPPLATVVWIDRFGNALTDLPRAGEAGRALDAGATLLIGGTRVEGPYAAFGLAPAGRPFWYWGSGGTLEAALPGGDAAAAFGWRRGMAVERADR